MRIIEIGAATFASARLSCTLYPEADRRVAMGMIRDVSAMTSSMKDTVAHGQRRDLRFDSDPTLPATGRECRDPGIDTGVQSGQALDPSRSRGYGPYEI